MWKFFKISIGVSCRAAHFKKCVQMFKDQFPSFDTSNDGEASVSHISSSIYLDTSSDVFWEISRVIKWTESNCENLENLEFSKLEHLLDDEINEIGFAAKRVEIGNKVVHHNDRNAAFVVEEFVRKRSDGKGHDCTYQHKGQPACTFYRRRAQLVRQHVLAAFGARYVCCICGSDYARNSILNEHKKIHEYPESYFIKVDGVSITRRNPLKPNSKSVKSTFQINETPSEVKH